MIDHDHDHTDLKKNIKQSAPSHGLSTTHCCRNARSTIPPWHLKRKICSLVGKDYFPGIESQSPISLSIDRKDKSNSACFLDACQPRESDTASPGAWPASRPRDVHDEGKRGKALTSNKARTCSHGNVILTGPGADPVHVDNSSAFDRFMVLKFSQPAEKNNHAPLTVVKQLVSQLKFGQLLSFFATLPRTSKLVTESAEV